MIAKMYNGDMQKLIEILKQIEDLEWHDAIYSEDKQPFKEDTLCAIFDPDEEEDADPKLNFIMNVSQAQDVVVNARLQKEEVTDEEFIEAFNFYYLNDAFIDFYRIE